MGAVAEIFDAWELEKLKEAMDWIIPPDSSPGAGTEACLAHLLDLIQSLGPSMLNRYKANLPYLYEHTLQDPDFAFGPHFRNHVRDCYYGYADTGAWEDIGFQVTG